MNEYITKIANEYATENESMYAKAQAERSKELRDQFGISISELEQLGLIRSYTNPGLGWDAVATSEYRLTDYGKMFTSVIKP
jgi:hypothetical protein